tara:strand:- start:1006 stop:1938 length:933 start_codon:yes stop_codon:yes gene_type:complete
MYNTKIPNVLMNVERVFQDIGETTFEGWIYSTENKTIDSLVIEDKSIDTIWHDRPDVVEYFKGTIPSNKIGFTITLQNNILSKNLYIMFDGSNTLLELTSLLKEVVSKSGFNRTDKDVIVVDNFYANPDLVRGYAMNNLEFAPSNYHKGQRSQSRYIIDGTKEKLEEVLGKRITNWNDGGYANGVFQFCTADQPIVYHVDSQMYAAMVYLTPDAPPQTGTAMYRSKVTGISSFPGQESRMGDEYVDTFRGNNKEMNFFDGTQFEKIDDIGNVYNRLVIFNSSQLHAATEYFGDAIDNARFFHMFFFDVEQ